MSNLTPVPMRKTRPFERPYEVYRAANGWEWRILKSHQKDRAAEFARAYVAATSPFITGYEYGDTYWSEILKYGTLVETNYAE